jgi:RNA polymerase sigma-70 factor (ECF subfamily)
MIMGTVEKAPFALTAHEQQQKIAKSAAQDFDTLFSEHWGRVYAVLFRLLGDHAAAEDLALEVFWRLYQEPPKGAEGGKLIGWLYRVATNLGYNALRGAKRRGHYESEAGIAYLEQNTVTDPAVEAERNMHRQQVRNVFTTMKPRSVNLLILRHSGFAYAEIAEILGVSPGSIGTLLARAEREFERKYNAAYCPDQ